MSESSATPHIKDTPLLFFPLFFVCVSLQREKYRYDKKSNMLSNCSKMISFSFWPSFDIRHYTYDTDKKNYRSTRDLSKQIISI